MFSRFKLPIFLFFGFLMILLIVLCTTAMAQAAAPPAVASQAGTLVLPSWLAGILGGGAGIGAGVWAILKGKVGQALNLVADCKLVISDVITSADFIKGEIKSPEAAAQWNRLLTDSGNTLIATGNKSLVQKGQFLLSKRIGIQPMASLV